MARTRRRSQADPQRMREIREELGIGRLHLDKWFGHNNTDQQCRISLPSESTPYTTIAARAGAELPAVDETFILLNSS